MCDCMTLYLTLKAFYAAKHFALIESTINCILSTKKCECSVTWSLVAVASSASPSKSLSESP